MIPTTPWEGVWHAVCQWFGVDEGASSLTPLPPLCSSSGSRLHPPPSPLLFLPLSPFLAPRIYPPATVQTTSAMSCRTSTTLRRAASSLDATSSCPKTSDLCRMRRPH